MEYPLCDQTVTLYRPDGEKMLRLVIRGCYLEISQGRQPGDERPVWDFLLVVPGSCQRVFPGDLMVPGIGPEQLTGKEKPIPITQVKRFCYNGALTHIEAR